MYTDMVGYTALGQRNESLSLALVDEQRKLIRPILNRHSGREVKTMGDAFLVEFPSALDAVRCAYDVQRAVREFNISLPEERRVHLRVGIHLGDVVESAGDISGDAVNVASRIEPLSEDGGVCLTRQVYDHVHNKFDLPLESMGVKSLKNVSTPIEIYKMVMPWNEGKEMSRAPPDEKRIAVLPFTNISRDPADEYFADGVTEELISTISGIGGLQVISRTSVMGYKGTSKKLPEIGRELMVGSVLEGSVRKADAQVRVTVQLIDVNSDRHLWAQSYDRELKNIFALQSDIAEKVAETLKVKLLSGEAKQLGKTQTTNTEAYTLYLKGRQLQNEMTDSSLRQALEMFNQAIKLDPSFARAHVAMGECYGHLGIRSYISFDESVAGMKSAVKRALELDENLAEGHYLLSWVAWAEDDHTLDEVEARRAIELNPNLADAHVMLGVAKATQGYPKESIRILETGFSLDPLSSSSLRLLGSMYIHTGMREKALELFNRYLRIAPFPASELLVSYYAQIGDLHRADEELRQLESRYPKDFTVICDRGYLSALQGDKETTTKIVEKLLKEFSGGATLDRNIGYIRYYQGDVDAFFDAMIRASKEHVLDPFLMRYSSLFDKARKDPRYAEVMRLSGLDPEPKEE